MTTCNTPICQAHVNRSGDAYRRALGRIGRCHVCGVLCDGLHSLPGGPLLICDGCCPYCQQKENHGRNQKFSA